MTKVLYVFDSVFRTNVKLAKQAEGILKEMTSECRVRRTEQVSGEMSHMLFGKNKQEIQAYAIVSQEDMEWADCYIVASPIHTGMISASTKFFLDSYHTDAAKGKFLNKPFTVIVTGGLNHGGAERAVDQLHSVAMQWGCLVVSTSITDAYSEEKCGNPYGLSFIVNKEQPYDDSVVAHILKDHLARFVGIAEILSKAQMSEALKPTLPAEATVHRITDIFGK